MIALSNLAKNGIAAPRQGGWGPWLRALAVIVVGLMGGFSAQGASTVGASVTAVEELQKRLLVVYNENDNHARELAFTYAAARSLDRSQLLAIRCPVDEVVTHDVYLRTIRDPIRAHLIDKGLLEMHIVATPTPSKVLRVEVAKRNDVWAIVLIRGVPLRISNDDLRPVPAAVPEQFRRNESAVDSELSLLVYGSYETSGFVPNPYANLREPSPFDAVFARSLVLVTRLDAPTPAMVRRMIRDSIATERLELTGRAVFDARGMTDNSNGYWIGDDWIRKAAATAGTAGLEVLLDDVDPLIPATQPLNDVALYGGWYSGDIAGWPTRPDFNFRPGAVAYHIHSFSARTLRSDSAAWTGPLIARGAAATMGSVWEPYLQLTPNVHAFFHGLLKGQTFAEAAYQSQAVLSWMITMVGDPLYRPFPRDPMESAQIAQERDLPEQEWMCLRIARLIGMKNISSADKIDRATRMVDALPTPVTLEGLGDMLVEWRAPIASVVEAYRRAIAVASSPVDRIRVGLKLAAVYADADDTAGAMAEYERILADEPKDAPRFAVPSTALALAARTGWNDLSPALRAHLAPVGAPNGAGSTGSSAKGTATETPANALPAPRRDLIPPKPTFTPPQPGEDGRIPAFRDPTRLPPPGS